MNDLETNVKVPDTLHQLLQLALDDLKKVEEDDKYTIDMYEWHRYNPNADKCAVCLAGCLLSQTLNIPRNKTFSFFRNNKKWNTAIEVIDYLRFGQLKEAAQNFYGITIFDNISNIEDFDIVEYDDDSELFKEQIQRVIKYLKKLDI